MKKLLLGISAAAMMFFSVPGVFADDCSDIGYIDSVACVTFGGGDVCGYSPYFITGVYGSCQIEGDLFAQECYDLDPGGSVACNANPNCEWVFYSGDGWYCDPSAEYLQATSNHCSSLSSDETACIADPFCIGREAIVGCYMLNPPNNSIAGMPTIETSGYNSLLAALGTAMTGIVGFFVDGAALWLTLAAALIVIYFFRRWLRVVKSKSVLWQDTGHTKPKYPKSNV